MILLHGSGQSFKVFDGISPMLSAHFEVFAVDLPGFGLSNNQAQKELSTSYYIEFLNKFMKKLNISRPILIGTSLGGKIAWRYALKYPESTKSLILLAPGGTAKRKGPAFLKHLISFSPARSILSKIGPRELILFNYMNSCNEKLSIQKFNEFYDIFLKQGNRAAFYNNWDAASSELMDLFPISDIPTLLIWGKEDKLISIKEADKISSYFSNIVVKKFNNLGHFSVEEDPKLIFKNIKEFLIP
ncbi:MAG: alpha/beta hydrolase [Bacteriovoracaceae bacterium]|nr:alpha/beta hydrolase [Bacteriovoracaceae bacterium]